MNTEHESSNRVTIQADADLIDSLRKRIGADNKQQAIELIIDSLQRVYESDLRQRLEDVLIQLIQKQKDKNGGAEG